MTGPSFMGECPRTVYETHGEALEAATRWSTMRGAMQVWRCRRGHDGWHWTRRGFPR